MGSRGWRFLHGNARLWFTDLRLLLERSDEVPSLNWSLARAHFGGRGLFFVAVFTDAENSRATARSRRVHDNWRRGTYLGLVALRRRITAKSPRPRTVIDAGSGTGLYPKSVTRPVPVKPVLPLVAVELPLLA